IVITPPAVSDRLLASEPPLFVGLRRSSSISDQPLRSTVTNGDQQTDRLLPFDRPPIITRRPSIADHRLGLSSIPPESLDLGIDARRQIELHQRIHRLRRRIENIHEPLVGANLELLARFLVD